MSQAVLFQGYVMSIPILPKGSGLNICEAFLYDQVTTPFHICRASVQIWESDISSICMPRPVTSLGEEPHDHTRRRAQSS